MEPVEERVGLAALIAALLVAGGAGEWDTAVDDALELLDRAQRRVDEERDWLMEGD